MATILDAGIDYEKAVAASITKKGRLAKESLNLLEQCGLKFRVKENALLAHVDNFPIDLLFVRDDDIPTLVFDRLCDGGIVGENVLQEAALAAPDKSWHTILGLGTCHCRLSLAVPEEFDYQGPGSIDGMRIATSYPYLLDDYLKRQKLCAESIPLSGSVEVAPRMGMADAICDLVSSGQTLEDNKLVEVETIFESQAILIQANSDNAVLFSDLFDMLKRRIKACSTCL